MSTPVRTIVLFAAAAAIALAAVGSSAGRSKSLEVTYYYLPG